MATANLMEDAMKKGWGKAGAAALPSVSPATGLPMGVEELAKTNNPALMGTGLAPGVEQRAKEARANFMGPAQPTIVNGIRPDGTSTKVPPGGGDAFNQAVAQMPAPGAGTAPMTMRAPGPGAGTTVGPDAFTQAVRSLPAPDVRSGPISQRPAVPKGRSANDPNRIAEQQRRRGNVQPILDLARDDKQMGFQKEMFGLHQAAMDGREERRYQRDDDAFNRSLQVEMEREQRGDRREEERWERNTKQRMDESDTEYMRRQDAERERAERAGKVNLLPDPRNPGQMLPNYGMTGNGQMMPLPGPPEDPEAGAAALEEYARRFPDANVTGKLPGGVTVTKRPAGQERPPQVQTVTMPGPMIPDPTTPGKMMEGPPVRVKLNPDGTYEPLRPKPVNGKAGGNGGKSYGDSVFKKK